MNLEQQMRERLAALEPVNVEIRDESGNHIGHAEAKGGGHYRMTVVSDAFTGKSRIERHRMVYGVFSDLMHREIHALAIEAYTPDEL